MGWEPKALVVELLYERTPELDAEALAERVRETLPGTIVLGDDEQQVTLMHRDFPVELPDDQEGGLLTLVARPGEDRVNERDLGQTWDFDGAAGAVSRATTTLLVAEMLGASTGMPAEGRARAFSAVVRAVVEHAAPLAIWSAGGEKLVDPARVSEHPLTPLVNVRMFRVEDDEGVMAMDTLGLHVLGLPDFQIHFRDLEPGAIAGMLQALAIYVVEEMEIPSGDTVSGPEGDERWRVQHEEALVAPDRLVLDIDPGPPYAAGERG